jgi:hypothetical protein
MQQEIDIELQEIPLLNNIEINNISIQNNSFGLFSSIKNFFKLII